MMFFAIKKNNIMEDITQEIRAEVIIYKVNLLKASVNEAAELRNLLDEQITIGHSKIVVDLSQCTYLDSTFIGVLVVTHKKLLAKGGKLIIINPLDPAKRLFHLSGISKVLNTFEATEDAVRSFNNRIKSLEPKSDDVIPKKSVEWAFT
ncbi:MAG: anti-sigma factor antagonist [Deltaproteobacteria bacterium]|nr:MAG: anti-sigma factor antagonist [Deltaproteobacteria bacterium]